MLAEISPLFIGAFLAVVLAVVLVLPAGGSSGSIRSPYPKGDDGVIPLIFSGLSRIAGNGTGVYNLVQMTLPFACKCVYAEIFASGTAVTDADADTTITVIDDTGTPKVWVVAVALTALAAHAQKVLTVDKAVEFFEQAILKIQLNVGDDGDVFNNLTVVLWVKPTH